MINVFIVRSLLKKEDMNVTQLILIGIFGMCVVSFFLCFKCEITHCVETFIGWATERYKIEIDIVHWLEILVGSGTRLVAELATILVTKLAKLIKSISILFSNFSLQPDCATLGISSNNSSVKLDKPWKKWQLLSSSSSAGNTGGSSNSAVVRAGNTGNPNRANFGKNLNDLMDLNQPSTQFTGQIAAPSSSAQTIVNRVAGHANATSNTNTSVLAEPGSSQASSRTYTNTLKIYREGQTGSFFEGNSTSEIQSNRAKYI